MKIFYYQKAVSLFVLLPFIVTNFLTKQNDIDVITELVSISSDGIQSMSWSGGSAISGDGRYVVYVSPSVNLVENDTNNALDIFVFDRLTRITSRVSVSSYNEEANNNSDDASLSFDGRYVIFRSGATNLAEGTFIGSMGVFVRDRDTDNDGIFDELDAVSTSLVPNSDGMSKIPSISGDGSLILYAPTELINDKLCPLAVYNQFNNQRECVVISYDNLPVYGDYFDASLSENGRYVCYPSTASNLVYGDTNQKMDIFRFDRVTDQTIRVSVSSDGEESNGDSEHCVVSADGRYISFTSLASNLVDNDIFGYWDVFLYDLDEMKITRISESNNGDEAFNSSQGGAISSDGRYIAFSSLASNLVLDDSNSFMDIFIHDQINGENYLVSKSYDGSSSNGTSAGFTGKNISSDGLLLAFQSEATNLVNFDLNGKMDVFVTHIQFPVSLYLPIIANN